MIALRINILRLLLLVFILSSLRKIESDKIDSRRRLPSRRRSPRNNLDQYVNELPSDTSRAYSEDTRNYPSEESRGYSPKDSRSYESREYDEYPNEDEFEQSPSIAEDSVLQYTSTLSSKVMISICSGQDNFYTISCITISRQLRFYYSLLYNFLFNGWNADEY